MWGLLSCAGSPERFEPPLPSPPAPSVSPVPVALPAHQFSVARVEEQVREWLAAGLPEAVESSWSDAGWGRPGAGPTGTWVLQRDGQSGDRLVLAAAKPVDESSAYDAALLLEVARVYDARQSEGPPHYSMALWLMDPEPTAVNPALATPDNPTSSPPDAVPKAVADGVPRPGEARPELETAPGNVRFALALREAAAAPLTIARDLNSHPVHREMLLDLARARGLSRGEHFERPEGVATGLRAAGVRDLVFLAPSGDPAHTKECCDAETLLEVGEVVLAGVSRVAAQLERIEQYARRPVPPSLDDIWPREASAPEASPPQAPRGADSSETSESEMNPSRRPGVE